MALQEGLLLEPAAPRPNSKLRIAAAFFVGLAIASLVTCFGPQSSSASYWPTALFGHPMFFSNEHLLKSEAITAEASWCSGEDFRDITLKTVVDATMFGLLPDIAKEKKFEMSGVVLQEHGFYGICDSSWSISVFHDLSSSGSFHTIYDASKPPGQHWMAHTQNYLAAPADEEAFPHDVDSQWEAITWNYAHNRFIAVQESVVIGDGKYADGKYHAVFMEVEVERSPKPIWHLVRACPSEFEFADDSKGFEGALGMKGIDGRFFLLGLCEGNHCGTGKVGKEKGNGRLVIQEYDGGDDHETPNTFKGGFLQQSSTCKWKTVKMVDLPTAAHFEDYSDVARRGNSIAITSQASSMLLLAKMTLTDDGLLDPDTFEVHSPEVRRFAPTDTCQVQYCNVEAIDFINDRLLVGGSDSMKGGGRQAYTCLDKDQSMHVFALPAKTKI